MSLLPDVVNGLSEIAEAVGEGAVRPVLDAEAPVVGVVDAHPRLVILEVVATLRVSGRAVKKRAAENKWMKLASVSLVSLSIPLRFKREWDTMSKP